MRTALLKHWALFSMPILLMLLAVWFGFATENDVAVFFKEHSTSHPEIAAPLKFITDWSNPVFYILYGLMLLHAYKSNNDEGLRFILVLLVVQLVVAVGAVHFTKHVIGRPRPGQGWYFDPLTTRGTYHSFPSGHTTEITGWSLPFAFRQAQFWLTGILGLLVGVVGFSRIYLGWHHPSDVFFGWLLGSFGGFATHIIVGSSLFRKKSQ